jgi:hypothetical protein
LIFHGSPGRTRTADKVVNSHLLYRLSYRGLGALGSGKYSNLLFTRQLFK